MRRLVVSMILLAFIALLSLVAGNKNIYGDELQSCSSEGMARTGFLRDGYCASHVNDRGSHHICINLNSTFGGNFCLATGQSDWCSSSNMPCHHDRSQSSCQIRNWCVCQWAFASYIQNAGGCHKIQTIICDAINMEAMVAYEKSTMRHHRVALDCILERCGSIKDDKKDEL